MVPTVDTDGNTLVIGGNTAAVSDGVLSGQTAIGNTPYSDAANASGIASTQRHFVPVNAPGENDAGGIDYGTDAQNLAAQRLQCEEMVGTDSGNSDREIAVAVYGN